MPPRRLGAASELQMRRRSADFTDRSAVVGACRVARRVAVARERQEREAEVVVNPIAAVVALVAAVLSYVLGRAHGSRRWRVEAEKLRVEQRTLEGAAERNRRTASGNMSVPTLASMALSIALPMQNPNLQHSIGDNLSTLMASNGTHLNVAANYAPIASVTGM